MRISDVPEHRSLLFGYHDEQLIKQNGIELSTKLSISGSDQMDWARADLAQYSGSQWGILKITLTLYIQCTKIVRVWEWWGESHISKRRTVLNNSWGIRLIWLGQDATIPYISWIQKEKQTLNCDFKHFDIDCLEPLSKKRRANTPVLYITSYAYRIRIYDKLLKDAEGISWHGWINRQILVIDMRLRSKCIS